MSEEFKIAAAELELRRRAEREALEEQYNWRKNARPKQLPPDGDWDTWMVLAGRGFGKTRTGAEWIRELVEKTDRKLRIALVGRTPSDVRDVMIYGPTGIMTISPPWNRPLHEPSKRRLTWKNGSVAITYSYQNPDELRGPGKDFAWCDELASAPTSESWDNLMFGMREGEHPQTLITTTPRPTSLIKTLAKSSIVVTGSTYENKENLAKSYIKYIEEKYANTRLGRQEIFAEILEDIEGALWTLATIDRNKVKSIDRKLLSRIVVAVDPSASSDKDSDETGIIVCGLGTDTFGYVLDDFTILGTPNERAHQIKRAYEKWEADFIIAEKNNGGDMVEYMIKTVDPQNKMPVKLVHASRGKFTRAEPIAALYEQNKIKHVDDGTGRLQLLEDELCSWTPIISLSPNRLDALVWGFTKLMLNDRSPRLRQL